MKHRIAALSAMLLAATCASPLTAPAYSVDDVAARARAAGYPEDVIQAGYNEWATGKYSQDDLDNAYFELSTYDEKLSNKVREKLAGKDSQADSAADSAVDSQVDSAADSQIDSITDSAAGSRADSVADPITDSAADSKTNPAADSQADSAADPQSSAGTGTTSGTGTGTTSGTGTGTTSGAGAGTSSGERISSSEFIHMTLEEKQTYIQSLDTEAQDAFFDSMTTEERNSIIKQLSVDEKAEIMEGYVSAADAMGMNVAVDQITDSNISVTIRNDEGTVINKAAVGVTIDETGISHTAPLAWAAGLGLAALAGLAAVSRKMHRSDE
ncbi:MAG: hypothetical protein IJ055_02495 [Oscillospiraceae bacterium]|nr:hypothetical protein [Oscillospiraceae bacterium]